VESDYERIVGGKVFVRHSENGLLQKDRRGKIEGLYRDQEENGGTAENHGLIYDFQKVHPDPGNKIVNASMRGSEIKVLLGS